MVLSSPQSVGRPLGFASEAALGASGLPKEARCGGGAAAGIAGALAAPGTQGSRRLGKQEVRYSEGFSSLWP